MKNKSFIALAVALVGLISLSWAFTEEVSLQVKANYGVEHPSEDPLCRDIVMDNGVVYSLSAENGSYMLRSVRLDNRSGSKTALDPKNTDAGSDVMLSVCGNDVYVLDNGAQSIFRFDLAGALKGTYSIPAGRVVSFDTNGGKGYMQYEEGMTLACYDFASGAVSRAYRYDDGFGGGHELSSVSVNRDDGTIRLARLADDFIIEDFDLMLNPAGMKKTDLPFKPASFTPGKQGGDLIVNNVISTKKADLAPRVSGRLDSALFPVEICSFKAGKKYPDAVYMVKGLERFKGYVKLLGIYNGSLVLYAHDENGSVNRLFEDKAPGSDFILISKKI